MTEREYQQRVKALMPRSKTGPMCLKAFLVGGLICCLGQLITDLGQTYLQLTHQQAGTLCTLCLIFLAGLLTALGVFDKIAAFAESEGLRGHARSPLIRFEKEDEA